MATIIGNNMPQDFFIPAGVILDEPVPVETQPVPVPAPLLPPVEGQLQQLPEAGIPAPVQPPIQAPPPPEEPPISAPQDFFVPAGIVLDEPGAIPEEEPQGFFGRTEEGLQQRGANLADVFGRMQTAPETIFQTVGTELAAVGDIAGEGVVSAAKFLPDAIKEPVVAGVQSFLNTNAGKAGIKALSKGVKNWEAFKERNPRAAANIEAGFNIGTFFPAAIGVGILARGVRKGIRKATTRAPVVTSDDLGTLASNEYKRITNLQGNLTSKFSGKFVENIEKLTPQTEIGKKVAGETPFTQLVERIKGVGGESISLQAAQEFDEVLGDAVDGFIKEGRLTKQGKKVLDIQTTFRDSIAKATPDMIEGGKEGFDALKKGRKLWAASRRLDDVERIIARAEFKQNPATSIRAGFATLVNNPKRLRGFNKNEISLMRKAAKTGILSDILRVTAGSRLIPIFTAATGGFGATTAATAASLAARGVTTRATLRQAEAVARAVGRRGLEP